MGEQHEPEFLETETIDFNSLFTRDVTSSGTFDLSGLEATSLGKLLQTIPLPAMLVDGACAIAFANQASQAAGFHRAPQQPGSFALLFADSSAASHAEMLIKRVFATRKSEVIEAPLKKGKSRLWGRIHLRSLRVGKRRSVLVIVEDLTPDDRRALLEHKHALKLQRAKDVLEKRLAQSTANLRASNAALRKERADRKRVEESLRKANEKLQCYAAQHRGTPDKTRPGTHAKCACRGSAVTTQKEEDPRRLSEAIKDFRNFLTLVRNAALLAEEDLSHEDLGRARRHLEKLLKHCAIADQKLERHASSDASGKDTAS